MTDENGNPILSNEAKLIEADEAKASIRRQIGRLDTFLKHATEEDFWQVPQIKREIRKLEKKHASMPGRAS